MTGKFGNGQTKSDWWNKMHGNSHRIVKKVDKRESNNKHTPVGDGEANSKSQRGDGSSMYEVKKKAAASNSKQPDSIFGRSSNKHDIHADCTYTIEQTDTNAEHLYYKKQMMESGRNFGQSNAQQGRGKMHHMFHQDNGFRAQKLPSKAKWVARKVAQCSKNFGNGMCIQICVCNVCMHLLQEHHICTQPIQIKCHTFN